VAVSVDEDLLGDRWGFHLAAGTSGVVVGIDEPGEFTAGLVFGVKNVAGEQFPFQRRVERLGCSVVQSLSGQCGPGLKRFRGARLGQLASAARLSAFDMTESFFVLSDSVGDGFESGSEVADLGLNWCV